MKTVGLITEYNPFHNGHKYHIEEAKRLTGADYAIAVMSGNFVQRGTPAVIDKYSRAQMALQNGVDLVLELPACYATGSAEFFAHGAVSLLDKLGIVDSLCFGSECGNIGLQNDAARFLSDAPAAFNEQLQGYLKDGLTFPAARLKALQYALKEADYENGLALSEILTEPNNILGIEYVKAIHHLNSSMEPVTITRKSAHYHDKNLNLDSRHGAETDTDSMPISSQNNLIISSATAIRKAINSSIDNAYDNFEDIKMSVPESVFKTLTENHRKTYPITEEDFSQILRYKLLAEDRQSLAGYLDISGDLADRMKNISDINVSIMELAQKIKTKNMTLTRINRALVHLLLNIRSTTVEEYNRNGYTQYARVLGIKKESSKLLRTIEKAGRIPIITKLSKAEEQLDDLGMRMLSEDIFATHLYNQAVYEKYNTKIPNEYKHVICIL